MWCEYCFHFLRTAWLHFKIKESRGEREGIEIFECIFFGAMTPTKMTDENSFVYLDTFFILRGTSLGYEKNYKNSRLKHKSRQVLNPGEKEIGDKYEGSVWMNELKRHQRWLVLMFTHTAFVEVGRLLPAWGSTAGFVFCSYSMVFWGANL